MIKLTVIIRIDAALMDVDVVLFDYRRLIIKPDNEHLTPRNNAMAVKYHRAAKLHLIINNLCDLFSIQIRRGKEYNCCCYLLTTCDIYTVIGLKRMQSCSEPKVAR